MSDISIGDMVYCYKDVWGSYGTVILFSCGKTYRVKKITCVYAFIIPNDVKYLPLPFNLNMFNEYFKKLAEVRENKLNELFNG